MYRLGNIPVNRVKLQAKQEYEYISNYKVLQNGFKANAIDKVSVL
jgi:RP/EB family microtubule-associated protein